MTAPTLFKYRAWFHWMDLVLISTVLSLYCHISVKYENQSLIGLTPLWRFLCSQNQEDPMGNRLYLNLKTPSIPQQALVGRWTSLSASRHMQSAFVRVFVWIGGLWEANSVLQICLVCFNWKYCHESHTQGIQRPARWCTSVMKWQRCGPCSEFLAVVWCN